MTEEQGPAKISIKIENEENTWLFVFHKVLAQEFTRDFVPSTHQGQLWTPFDLVLPDPGVGEITLAMKPKLGDDGVFLTIYSKNDMDKAAWEKVRTE